MKALSIRQPWAELIVQGRKTIEIRSWNTRFRGPFLVHASKNPDRNALELFKLENLEYGKIIGIVDLVDVVRYTNKSSFLADKDKHLGSLPDHFPVYGFVLRNPRRINPISVKGRLGFFEFDFPYSSGSNLYP